MTLATPGAAHDYRPDIDGLRAVAVLSVVLYHAGLWLPGGFAGVDVFFVISGYLITGIIAKEASAGTFSLARFYERRIRRIFPALYATIALTVVLSLALLPAVDQKRVFDALAWLSVFASNVYFMENSGYFDAATEHHPFLQTWSLAIEEQFYVAFPLAFAAALRWGRIAPKWIVLAFLVASLAYSAAIVDRDMRTAFFSAPGRAWELLLGCALALGVFPQIRSQSKREAIGWAGLASIVLSFLLLNKDTAFPGLSAVPVTLGTALVIWSGSGPEQSGVSRILAARPLVWTGLISYSLYLVHWPLFAFMHVLADEPPHWLARLALVGLSVALAWASWRFVERPFRRHLQPMPQAQLFAAAACAICLTAIGALAMSWRLSERLTGADKAAESHRAAALAEPCMIKESAPFSDWPASRCKIAGDGVPIWVWGDSHAAHYFGALRTWAAVSNRDVTLLAMSSCPPIAGLPTPNRKACAPFNDEVMRLLLKNEPGIVVISASWMTNEKKRSVAESFEGKLALLNSQIARLRQAGKRVVVLGPGPVFPSPVPQIVSSEALDADGSAQASVSRMFDAFFRRSALSGEIAYLPVFELFCSPGLRCRYRDGADWLIWDDAHLTAKGAQSVMDALAPELKP